MKMDMVEWLKSLENTTVYLSERSTAIYCAEI